MEGHKMKIAIESNDGVTIKSPFIHTRGYLVYDINESDIIGYEYRESKEGRSRQKEDSSVLKGTQSLLKDCKTVISRGMDRNNLTLFKQKGIDVFITFKTSAKDAVRLYLKEIILGSIPH
jgi:predicted Fe-Mo cluster-binding NifX family protein